MGVNDEDNLHHTVFLWEFLCNKEVGGGLVILIVDILRLFSLGAWDSVEGAFHEHQLGWCEAVFMKPGLVGRRVGLAY